MNELPAKGPTFPAGDEWSTLVDLLCWRAFDQPDQKAYAFLTPAQEEDGLTYAALDRQARAIGAMLQRRSAAGERVLLLYPSGLAYIEAFFGCLYAGAIAVPAYPPHANRYVGRIQSIVDDAQATFVLTTSQIASEIQDGGEAEEAEYAPRSYLVPDLPHRSQATPLQWIATDVAYPEKDETLWQMPQVTGSTLAFLQYTSGSTTTPKGVMVSHSNLLNNHRMLQRAMAHPAGVPFVSWLPLYHDMGLIMQALQALYMASPCILLSPAVFVESPFRWLEAISLYQAHTSGAPNFAYDLCVKKITVEQRDTLDLRSWQFAFCAAEPVRYQTLSNFNAYFAPCGLRIEALKPCYGLAEATVFVTGYQHGLSPAARLLEKEALERHQVVLQDYQTTDPSGSPTSSMTETEEKSIACTNCGRTELDARVVIVDPETCVLSPPGSIGEIWVAGSHIAQGYWKRDEETAVTFHAYTDTGEGPFLRTGDLGFLLDGDLFVTGRLKDIILIYGRNLYPQDIEWVVENSHPLLRAGCCAAFAVEGSESEQLVVVQEVVRHADEVGAQEAIQAIRQAVLAECNAEVAVVELLPAGTIFKTSSGKIQRSVCRQAFLKGELNAVYRWHDRRGSPHRDFEHVQEDERSSHMPDELQKKLWAEILQLEHVGASDNFFALGGHSLLAMQLLARIQKVFAVELALNDLLEAPTLSSFAELVAQKRAAQANVDETGSSCLPTLSPDQHRRYEPFPLTDLQQAYWIGRTETFASGNVSTHLYLEYESDQLDLQRLEQAWNRLIKRHEMLRAVMLSNSEQCILPETPFYAIAVSDLRASAAQEVEAQLRAIRERLSHQVLRADQWPLFEICAAILDQQRTRLFLSIDALICDYSSWHLLYQEWSLLYAHLEAPLAPLDISFRDHVLAEANLEHSALYQRSLAYWTARLQMLPPAPALPMSKTVGELTQIRFRRWESRLSVEQWAQVKARASQAGLTPSIVLLTAFAQVLATWSTNSRFTINVPLMHRLPMHPQINEVMGEFTSFILLEVNCSKPCSFRELANALQTQLWADINHHYVSGVRLLRELMHLRQGFRGPLMPIVYTSTLVWEKTLPRPTSLQQEALLDQILTEIYAITQTPQVWLDLQVHERNHTLYFNWDVVAELFPSGLPDDMFATYCRLLEQLSDDEEYWNAPMQHLLPHWQAEEQARSNATGFPLPHVLLQHLFERQAALHPSQLALLAPDYSFTYQQLARRVNRLARWLRAAGARPNQLVAIVMEKGWEQVAAALAILTAGAAYVPLDPSLPAQRQALLLQQGQVEIVLTQSWLAAQLPSPAPLCHLCVDVEALSEWDESPLSAVQTPQDLAYVIYTSGSTGQPKGVMIAQQGVVNCLLHTQHTFQIGPQDRALALSALHHDLSVFDLFGMLTAGATMVLPDAAGVKDPAHWAALLQQEQITIWNSVPALMQMLQEQVKQSGQQPPLPDSLRLVILGGDWIPISVAEYLQQWRPGMEVVSIGGPTETTVWNIWYRLGPIDPTWKSIPYGKPIANARYYILNERMQPCPMWVRGEMYCAGVGVALGYWADEERTHERFVRHPQTGEGLYRTGDLGCYHPDGTIEFLGRADLQVKIHGHRIELGEIEAALQQHPLICGAVVTVDRDQRLLAYVVLQKHEQAQGFATDTSAGLFHDAPDGVTLRDPIERARFKLRQPAVRKDVHKRALQLPQPEINEAFLEPYRQRRTRRNFRSDPLDLLTLSQFLSGLYQIEMDGLLKYRYASAGGLYPVQTYLYVKAQRVKELAGGIYYYHPKDHQLILLSANAHLDRCIHAEHNQPIFDVCAFEIFLIAHLDAIEPMYGKSARDFCLLDAGYMGHHLMLMAEAHGLGLCPIGDLDFVSIRPLFELDEKALLVHSLLGGLALPPQQSESVSSDERFGQQTNPSSGVLADQLYEYLRATLPAHMIPSAFVLLPAFPLTANGKIDRRSLPIPEQPVAKSHGDVAVPTTAVEESVVSMWCEVLGQSQVGLDDNFFAKGGNSLLGMRLLARVKKMFEVEISLARLFEAPTVAEMAQDIEDALRRRDSTRLFCEVAPLVPAQRGETIPLSFAQQRLWFLSQLQPESAAYIYPVVWHLRGTLSIQALQASLQALIQRHEILRTTFTESMGQPVQAIHAVGRSALRFIDLQELRPERQAEKALQLAEQATHCPCDLVNGPLLQASLLRLRAGQVQGKGLISLAPPADSQEHMLLFTVHQIIADDWSRSILMREMTALYRSRVNGEPASLSPLPIQYADYTLWQREFLQGEVLCAQMAYWKKQLADLSALTLPTNYPRPGVQTHRGASQSRLLPKAVSDGLLQLCYKQNVTLFMLLLAGFQVLLMRYSGQTDIAIGTPIANRSRAEVEGLIGFFVNTLVMRSDLSDNPTFLDLLPAVRQVCLQAYLHQDVPFEKVVEEIEPERDLSRSPLFQVMLVLQNTPGANSSVWDLAGVEATPLEAERTTSKFDLTLFVVEREQGLDCALEYSTDLFEAETMRRMLSHFQTLLEGIVDNPQARLSDLPLLTEAEREQLLIQWNATQTDSTPDLCVHQIFEEQVQHNPEAVALVFEDETLTYVELNRRANQLAHHLQKGGLGPEGLVGICLQRSLEMVIALLSVLKAGGAYVPLDPGLPQERLMGMLAEVEPSFILTETAMLSMLAPTRRPLIALDRYWPALRNEESHNPVSEVSAEHLMYVIYTSGSTGVPKGAMNTHQGLCNRLCWMQRTYQLTGTDRVVQKTPLSFDVSVWEVFWPLSTGASLIIAAPGGHQDPGYLKALIIERQVTRLHFVPSMLWAFLQESDAEDCQSLHHVFCSGEALSRELQSRFFATFTDRVQLENLYGPTEASIEVTSWSCQRESAGHKVPIGRPIANTQIYLLDSHLQPVPVGVTGELYIGGVEVGRGYWRQPALTAEKFIPHPFVTAQFIAPGARLYRTGDLACYRVDGTIEYLGRIDHQVKVRGYRIELEEIESVLQQHTGVCAVICVLDTSEDKALEYQLIAYVVPKQERPPTGSDLRGYLQAKLPAYMVPSSFVMLDALPLMPNGKVDRRALPKPDAARSEQEVIFIPPRTLAEEVVADIWDEILHVEQIGVYDNFFALGGHSLQAARIVSWLRDAFQVALSVRSLFEQPTIDGLVREIAKLRGGYSIIEEIALILKEIQQLSEEEMQDILK